MKYCTSFCLILLGVILVAGTASADIGLPKNLAVEASLSSGSTTNLYSDTSQQYCLFRAASLDLDYSVTPFAQVNLASEYTYYRQMSNLSNLSYSAGATLITVSDWWRFSFYVNGNVRDRRYRDVATDSGGVNANEFTGREYDAKIGLGYDLTPSVQLRTSLAYKSMGYDIEGVLDKKTYDAAIGGNASIFNHFSLDIELGYSTGKYQYIWPEYPFGDTVLPRAQIDSAQYDILLIDDLKSIYFSPRLSTFIGNKLGISLTYMVRNFQDHDENSTIYGYSSGFLSPWNNKYEGQGVVLNLKSYMVPRLVMTVTAGYWDKNYIRVVEYGTWWNQPRFGPPMLRFGVNLLETAHDRSDYRSRTSVTFKVPLTHSSGYFLEPTVTFDYTDNKSTIPVYNYNDFSVSGGLTVRF